MRLPIVFTLFAALLALTACTVPAVAPAANAPMATEAPAAATTESAPAPTTAARGDNWEPVDCATLNVMPEVAAVAECGYVTVPENRAAGTDKTIQLAVVRVPSTSAAPGAPIILGTGGPGGPGLQDVTSASGATFLTSHAPILADRDYILFTQRGSPQAQPTLACPDFTNVPLEAAINGWTARAETRAGWKPCKPVSTATRRRALICLPITRSKTPKMSTASVRR
ncbi:MAG: hypothetical protein IPK16_13390 [Anaerolineales bacterium]|nr:hypothetical protein [Anaerolineales bacterium]